MLWRCLWVWVSLWKSLCHFPLNFLAQDLPPNLKLIYLAQTAGQEAPEILLLPFSQHWGYRYMLLHLDFHVGARDTNSCPHVLSHALRWLSPIPSLATLLLSKAFHHPNGESCTLSVSVHICLRNYCLKEQKQNFPGCKDWSNLPLHPAYLSIVSL